MIRHRGTGQFLLKQVRIRRSHGLSCFQQFGSQGLGGVGRLNRLGVLFLPFLLLDFQRLVILAFIQFGHIVCGYFLWRVQLFLGKVYLVPLQLRQLVDSSITVIFKLLQFWLHFYWIGRSHIATWIIVADGLWHGLLYGFLIQLNRCQMLF